MSQKIRGIMNVDLNNDLAVRYMVESLKSFEIVSDIFEITVTQCVTPDTLLPNVNNNLSRRSPQELGSIHSNYRCAKRIAEGERIWVLEHDAYLRPECEEFFRMIMSKWEGKQSSINLGMANEFWTTTPEIAKMYCEHIEDDWSRGPMQLLHVVTDVWRRKNPDGHPCTYWPANRFRNPEWCNKTGLNFDVSSAYNKPMMIWDSPICQILDERYQSTVTDRPKNANLRTPENQPDMKWISLD